jgi:hypothetical protein
MQTARFTSRTGIVQGLLVFLIVFVQSAQRPGMLQMLGEVVGIAILALLLLYGFLGYRGTLTVRKVAFLGSVWLFAVYLWLQVLITGEGISRGALVNVFFIVVSSFTVVLLTRETWQTALKALVYPAMVFGVSYLVTVVLVFLAGVDLEALEVTSFNLAQSGVADRYLIPVYFPFSLSMNFGNVSFFGIPWARATGYMREPGLYQVIVSVAYFGVDYLEDVRWKKTWKGILLLSLFLTFSTAGVGAFLAAALYYYVLASRDTSPAAIAQDAADARASQLGWGVSLTALTAILGGLYWFIFTDQKFGLMRKLALGSGSARVQAVETATEALLNHPFIGVGYTNSVGKGFSFLGVTGEIGIIGVVLFSLVFLVPLVGYIRRRDRILALLAPPLLTALLAQPLFDKPLFYLIVALLVAYPHATGDAAPTARTQAADNRPVQSSA